MQQTEPHIEAQTTSQTQARTAPLQPANTPGAQPTVAVIIPAYEPDGRLPQMVSNLISQGLGPVIVVNDGSGTEFDHLYTQSEQAGATVLRHMVNLGKGRGLKTAFNECLRRWPHLVGAVTADSDGQHSIADIIKLEDTLRQNPKALVMGCRDFASSSVPQHNRWGNRITSVTMDALSGVKVKDTQTGLRAIPREYMKQLMNVPGERFEFETNMLLETRNSDIPIICVDIDTLYPDGTSRSHFRVLHDSARIYALFAKYLAASISSLLLDLLLFSLFVFILKPRDVPNYIILSTVLARIISSLYNFYMNGRVVFRKALRPNTFVKYYALAAVQMLASALLVNGLYSVLGWPEVSVKILVDMLLFFVSFQIQQRHIFR